MKKTGHIIIAVFVSILMIQGLSSCKSKGSLNTDKQDKPHKLKSHSAKKLAKFIEENYINYETFSSKLNVRFISKDKDQSVKAQLRFNYLDFYCAGFGN